MYLIRIGVHERPIQHVVLARVFTCKANGKAGLVAIGERVHRLVAALAVALAAHGWLLLLVLLRSLLLQEHHRYIRPVFRTRPTVMTAHTQVKVERCGGCIIGAREGLGTPVALRGKHQLGVQVGRQHSLERTFRRPPPLRSVALVAQHKPRQVGQRQVNGAGERKQVAAVALGVVAHRRRVVLLLAEGAVRNFPLRRSMARRA
ncbi:hypothetical protein H257_13797 [Aphanomyces astaci]|uniref:Uncharacterized protein n=1 Tax=Aphanomyces astaci TaxID=112090 RepID=W4FVN3_APHAT|nr:hypothetical protein H257_13797 [Aphanomyces astaci]ETV70698.1 hypothetical protein H257_13797 [Aphanomyces astaci]|eukprot:XP_009839762.1 hypothetical protein H257_13797 [Aphanomyces astaci]